MMIKSLQQHLDRKRRKIAERIAAAQQSGDSRRQKLIPALRGQMVKEEARIEQRIAELRLKATTKSQDKARFVGNSEGAMTRRRDRCHR
ncbi:hypothetical protein ACFSL5_06350 [Ottowia pentelensis]|uniref:hypothetical protein n=1 Tax=Ottowia pentelensis TaxID=511108 RepID=UPI00363783EB